VVAAYGGQRAISRLPEPRLLDAAHIVMDSNEQLGQPIVTNRLRHASLVRGIASPVAIEVSAFWILPFIGRLDHAA
jgi:hypothetical protein